MNLVRKLQGRKVISQDARTVGEVGGAYADFKNWKITHIAVELDNQAIELFGYQKPLTPFIGSVSVCLPITAVKVVGDIITLNKNFEELPSLPIEECKL